MLVHSSAVLDQSPQQLDASMSTASASTCEQEVHRQINPSKRPDELPRAEVDFDLHASMLCSDGWTKAPPRTRIYRQVQLLMYVNMYMRSACVRQEGQSTSMFTVLSSQVRTDVFEFFTEVRSTSGILQRVLPWKMRPSPAGPASPAADAVAPAQQALEAVCNFGIVLGGYVSGVLGGMAVMTILHLNLFNVNTAIGRSDLALQYYAPVALAVNRTYWGLICIAISSSISRFCLPSDLAHCTQGKIGQRGCASAGHPGSTSCFPGLILDTALWLQSWSPPPQLHGAQWLLFAMSWLSL